MVNTKLTAHHECGVLERSGRMMSHGCLPSRYRTGNIGKVLRTAGGGRDGWKVRWILSWSSYRDVEEMLAEPGLDSPTRVCAAGF